MSTGSGTKFDNARYLAAVFDPDGLASYKVFNTLKDAFEFVTSMPIRNGSEIHEFVGELMSIQEDEGSITVNDGLNDECVFQEMDDEVLVNDYDLQVE